MFDLDLDEVAPEFRLRISLAERFVADAASTRFFVELFERFAGGIG